MEIISREEFVKKLQAKKVITAEDRQKAIDAAVAQVVSAINNGETEVRIENITCFVLIRVLEILKQEVDYLDFRAHVYEETISWSLKH